MFSTGPSYFFKNNKSTFIKIYAKFQDMPLVKILLDGFCNAPQEYNLTSDTPNNLVASAGKLILKLNPRVPNGRIK